MSERRVEKAWLCTLPWLQGPGGLVRAPTRSKARYLGYLNAREAFDDVRITDIQVRRAADYDRHTFRDGTMPKFAEPPATELAGEPVEVGDD